MFHNPEIIEIEEIKFVGMGLDHNVHESAAGADPVPKLWTDFASRSTEIDASKNRYLGVCGPVQKGGLSNYVAALEVTDKTKTPLGMVSGIVPAGKYARFVHEGPIEKVWQTVDFIHNTWVPNAGYKDHDCSQVELYTWGTQVHSPDFRFEILVPLPH